MEENLIKALEALTDSEDSTGCDGVLTVIDRTKLADVIEAALLVVAGKVSKHRCDNLADYAVNYLGDDAEVTV